MEDNKNIQREEVREKVKQMEQMKKEEKYRLKMAKKRDKERQKIQRQENKKMQKENEKTSFGVKKKNIFNCHNLFRGFIAWINDCLFAFMYYSDRRRKLA